MWGHGLLKDKKTYVIGIVAVISVIANYFVGDAEISQVLDAIWKGALGTGLLTLRAGIAKSGVQEKE